VNTAEHFILMYKNGTRKYVEILLRKEEKNEGK
jgi:hypothetical protein